MKPILILGLLLLSACSVETTSALNFRNPQTGEVAAVCGPLTGFSVAVDEARKGCADSYRDDGWSEVN